MMTENFEGAAAVMLKRSNGETLTDADINALVRYIISLQNEINAHYETSICVSDLLGKRNKQIAEQQERIAALETKQRFWIPIDEGKLSSGEVMFITITDFDGSRYYNVHANGFYSGKFQDLKTKEFYTKEQVTHYAYIPDLYYPHQPA